MACLIESVIFIEPTTLDRAPMTADTFSIRDPARMDALDGGEDEMITKARSQDVNTLEA